MNKRKKYLIILIVALIIVFILNYEYPLGESSSFGWPLRGSVCEFFGYKEAQWDVNVCLSGVVTSGYMNVYLLDGVFENDNFTEEDIPEKQVISDYDCVTYCKKKVIEYIMEGLLRCGM